MRIPYYRKLDDLGENTVDAHLTGILDKKGASRDRFPTQRARFISLAPRQSRKGLKHGRRRALCSESKP